MKRRGMGIGTMFYGIGNTGHPNPASAFVEILADGTAIVLSGAADIGQGSDTVLVQIAAEELGISIEEVCIVSADTGVTSESGHTSASRTRCTGRQDLPLKRARSLALYPGGGWPLPAGGLAGNR